MSLWGKVCPPIGPNALRNFAESDYGQWWFELLSDMGMTPTEWGELDPHERLFLEQASQERNRRANEKYEKHS